MICLSSLSACNLAGRTLADFEQLLRLLVSLTPLANKGAHRSPRHRREPKIPIYYCFFLASNLATIFWTVSAKPASQK